MKFMPRKPMVEEPSEAKAVTTFFSSTTTVQKTLLLLTRAPRTLAVSSSKKNAPSQDALASKNHFCMVLNVFNVVQSPTKLTATS